MKIGDKVRFLNEVGGGVVSGFQDKETVLVRDEDGFDVPVLARECVVVETDNYNLAHPSLAGSRQADNRFRTQQPDTYVRSFDDDEDRKPVTFKPKPLERRGADVLNLFLAFVPVDARELTNTAFEAYLVNDSNYFVRFALTTQTGAAVQLRHEGLVEPNTKLFLEEFRRDVLPELERVVVQAFAYKEERSFRLKKPVDVALRIDGTKFYKLHTFAPTDFFEEPALLVDVVRDDRAVPSVFVDAAELRKALAPAAKPERPLRTPARTEKKGKTGRDAPLEVDLHASSLLETTAGMEAKDILDYQLTTFRKIMASHARELGRKIVFIHGKGDGVLRAAIIKELRARYKGCYYQDASFREYGFGATMVTIG